VRVDSVDRAELLGFLKAYPGMKIVPGSYPFAVRGNFFFRAEFEGKLIEDQFEIEMRFAKRFPGFLPSVFDISNPKRIPDDEQHHLFTDGSFCLGSPIRLKRDVQTLENFTNRALIPYLFAICLEERGEKRFQFGELDHGNKGLFSDYKQLFGLQTKKQVIQLLKALTLRKRIANKLPCPCGCKKRIGMCVFKQAIDQQRFMASRQWFQIHFEDIIKEEKVIRLL